MRYCTVKRRVCFSLFLLGVLCSSLFEVRARDTIILFENVVDSTIDLEQTSVEVVDAKLVSYITTNLYSQLSDSPKDALLNLFQVELFDGEKVTITPASIVFKDEYIELQGSILDHDLGYALIHITPNSLYGVLKYSGKQFQIKFLGDDPKSPPYHVIHDIDESLFVEAKDDAIVDDVELETESVISVTQTPKNKNLSSTIIDVLVVYTPSAQQLSGSYGGINALINLAESETNLGLRNSGVDAEIRVVHRELVNYTENNSYLVDLTRLRTKNDSYLDEVHGLRDQYGADIVILLGDIQGVCGVANLMTNPSSPSNADRAFATVAYNCAVGYFTFGHEIGHIIGARHNWEADNTNNSPFTFNHGYFDPSDTWRTIMSYSNPQCGVCTRIPYWSNPDNIYNEKAMGISEGNNFASDNRKTWSLTKNIVANYRDTVVPFSESKIVITPILYLLLLEE